MLGVTIMLSRFRIALNEQPDLLLPFRQIWYVSSCFGVDLGLSKCFHISRRIWMINFLLNRMRNDNAWYPV